MGKNRQVYDEMSENKKKALETIAGAFEKMSDDQKDYFVCCVERLGALKNRQVNIVKDAAEAWETFNRTGDRSDIVYVIAACVEKMPPKLLRLFLECAKAFAKYEVR